MGDRRELDELGAGADDFPASILAACDEVYRALYERPGPHVPVEAVNWRVVSTGPRPAFDLSRTPEAAGAVTLKGRRPVWFRERRGYVEVGRLGEPGHVVGLMAKELTA